MTREHTKRFKYDSRLDVYSSFYDHAWAKSISDLAAGSPLDEPVMSLLVSWKAAANTFLMPWLMITNFVAFASAFARSHESLSESTLGRIANHLQQAMRDSLSNMKRRQLGDEVSKLREKLRSAREAYDPGIDPQALFEKYLESQGGHELHLSLWGTQRIVYGSLYHSYEHFATCCIGKCLGDPNYRPTNPKQFLKDAGRVLSSEAIAYCIEDEGVQVARLVRNALAHHGGRESIELRGVPHGMEVIDGELQVMPEHVRALFTTLKDRALRLTRDTVTISQTPRV